MTTQHKTFIWHADPAHAWLEVTYGDIAALGLSVNNFSRYSYCQGNNLYLEEDCDASIFLDEYKARHGDLPSFNESVVDCDSFVRSLSRLPVPC